MEVLFLLGRIIFGGYFAYSGVNHFTQRQMMTGYAASKGVPAAAVAVPASGLLILLGGISVALGVWPQVGAWMIAIFLLGVTPKMHDFWAVREPGQRMTEMINFTKNFALLGAALVLASLREWPLSLGR